MTEDESSEKIVDDGTVCPDLYQKEVLKIAHLLKEPTEKNESLAKVIEDSVIKDGKVKGSLFKVTARRSYCIQNYFPAWMQLKGNESKYADALRRSAIVNMGPEPGEYSTGNERLEKLCTQWKERWYDKKLKALAPKIVICGGTFCEAEKILKHKGIELMTGMRYFVDSELGAVFLDCYHPSFRGNHAMEYCYFCESCKCLKELGKLAV